MTDKEQLYETLGELIYVIAKSDGEIQIEERTAMENLLKNHKWAKEIKWSFNYEESKQPSIDDLYKKVITVCHRIGPSPLYNEFIEAMKTIAEASNGIDNNETKVISSFSADLIERFKKDIEKI